MSYALPTPARRVPSGTLCSVLASMASLLTTTSTMPSTMIGRGNWHRSKAWSISLLSTQMAAVQDAYAIAIGHREGDLFIIDVVRSRHRLPRQATLEFAALCRQYRIRRVTGDGYAKDWVQDTWRETGLPYDKAEQPAAQLYLEAQPKWVQGVVRIHDDPVLVKELRHLEMIPGRVGKDQVTHPRNMHDDHANAVCGCIAMMAKVSTVIPAWYCKMQIERSNARAAAQNSGAYGSEWNFMGERAYGQMMRRRGGY